MSQEEPAANKLYDLVTQQILSKIILFAAELEFDKIIPEEGITVENLAKKTQLNEVSIFRFLRVLDAYDVVSVKENLVYEGALCAALEEIRGPHLLHGHKIMEHLSYSLKTNQECYSKSFGVTFNELVMNDPKELNKLKGWAEKSAHKWLLPALMHNFDFSEFDTVVEVGGWGHLQKKIASNSSEKSTIFLSFDELLGIGANEDSLTFKGRVVFVFLRSLLSQSDLQITNVISSLEKFKDAKVLIVDFLIPPKSHPRYQRSTIADINILTCLDGKLRTYNEWQLLLTQVGAQVDRFDIIEKGSSYIEPILPLFLMQFNTNYAGSTVQQVQSDSELLMK